MVNYLDKKKKERKY